MLRKSVRVLIAVLAVALVAGCKSDNTGEVGQKNLRPYLVDDYDRHGNRVNGVHSYDSPTYRTRFASDVGNERNRWFGADGLGNNIVGTHENHRIEMNDRVAAQVAALPEVDSAYVVLTDFNAYVGVIPVRKNGQRTAGVDRNPALKDKIADYVKSMSHTTQNVYVTSHPDFVNRMRTYKAASDGEGGGIQGFLIEFNGLAERIFPASSGTAGTHGAGEGTDLNNDTGTDSSNERGSSLTGRYGTYGTYRSYGPTGTSGYGAANR